MKILAQAHDERGFGIVAFLAFIPLLMAVLSVVTGIVLLLKTDSRLKHQCRTQLLEAQQEISGDLERLLQMNREAALLRSGRQTAEVAVKAARASGVPPAIAAAEAALLIVKTKQTAFHLAQRAIILKAKIASRYRPYKASFSVVQALNAELLPITERRAWPITSTRAGTFPLIEKPQGDPSPDYEPAQNFENEQRMEVQMTIDLAPILPGWAKNFLSAEKLKLKTECQASIEKEKEKWTGKLSAAR